MNEGCLPHSPHRTRLEQCTPEAGSGTGPEPAPAGHDGPMADTPIANTHQFEAWNGYEGRHWAEHQARYDALNDSLNGPLLDAAALRGTDTVLDIGCGNGHVTRLAARSAHRAVGIDLSTPCWNVPARPPRPKASPM